MKIKRIIPLLILVLLLAFAQGAYAASYTASLGTLGTYYGMISYTPFNVDLLGINKTHGFTQKILGTIRIDPDGRYVDVYLDYNVPNDGSTWEVLGTATIQEINSTSTEGNITTSYCLFNVDQTWTTPGTFTGVSLGQAVNAANAANAAAGQAKIAADNANTVASNAATNASNAYNSVNNSNGNTITAVRDASGTVLSEARQAKTNAANASNNAWYNGSTYGGTAQSVGNVAGYIAYNQLPAINQGLSQKIDNLSTTINNLAGVDNTPPTISVRTVSGAMATSGNYIQAVLNISDNVSSSFLYSLNNRDYEPVPENKLVTLPVPNHGPNVISVWVKDEAGNVGTSSITIRKL